MDFVAASLDGQNDSAGLWTPDFDQSRIGQPVAPELPELVSALLGSSQPLNVSDLTLRDSDPQVAGPTGTAVFALSFALCSALFVATLISGIALIRLQRHKYSGFDPGRTRPATTTERILRALLS